MVISRRIPFPPPINPEEYSGALVGRPILAAAAF